MGFPEIIMIDNFLSDEDFTVCEKEINDNRDKIVKDYVLGKTEYDEDHAKFYRWYPPNDSVISNIIDKYLFSDNIFDRKAKFKDQSWESWTRESGYEVQITKYAKEYGMFKWHTDHNLSDTSLGLRLINYILYMNTIDSGGELQISSSRGCYLSGRDEYPLLKTIKPKRNRLVIIPSWYIHRVLPVKSEQDRITTNGHIYNPKIHSSTDAFF